MLIFIGSNLFSRGTTETTQSKSATETKTITDHTGNTLEIPVNPKRIGGLHDAAVSIMLIELDVPIIGSATRRLKTGGGPYIKSSNELFNIQFEETGWYDYGSGYEIDPERIKISNPDLLVGMTRMHAKSYDVLSKIAPTILLDNQKKLDNYREIASLVGKEKYFNEEYAKYQKRLQEVKSKFTVPPDQQTITIIQYPDLAKSNQFTIYEYYGILHEVAYDLGFKVLEYVKKELANSRRASFNPEVFDELGKADYFITAVSDAYDQTAERLYETLDTSTPGWKEYMKAYKNGTFIMFEHERSVPASFQCANYILDMFEKHAK